MKFFRLVAILGLLVLPVLAQITATPPSTTTTPPDFFGGLFGSSTDAARTLVLEADLTTLNENPPIMDRDASGHASVQIRLDRALTTGANPAPAKATVIVELTTESSLAEVITQAHIHRGRSGTNGPVVLDFGLTTSTNTAPNAESRQNIRFEVTDPAKISIIQEILANPGDFYVNVHTQANPSGHIRGQLVESDLAALRRLEQRLRSRTEADLTTIKRLVVELAVREGIISSEERNTLLAPQP